MCKTYNTVGSLSTLQVKLREQGIKDLKTEKDIAEFQNAYPALRERIMAHHKELLEQEKNALQLELLSLAGRIENQRMERENDLKAEIQSLKERLNSLITNHPTSFFARMKRYYTVHQFLKKLAYRETHFTSIVEDSVRWLMEQHQLKDVRYNYITSNYEWVLRKSCQQEISDMERKKAVIDELRPHLLGAIGEERVVSTLISLPDEYSLINDFCVHFYKPIFYTRERDKIMSIQADHILIGPQGVFLIETKNWSEKSIEDLNLRSPVEQVKRTSYALYKLLHNEVPDYDLNLDKHHWGSKKIPIKNLIVMIHAKPREEFQYVKVLTLNELISYIYYFPPVLSASDIHQITEFLVNSNDNRFIEPKISLSYSSR